MRREKIQSAGEGKWVSSEGLVICKAREDGKSSQECNKDGDPVIYTVYSM